MKPSHTRKMRQQIKHDRKGDWKRGWQGRMGRKARLPFRDRRRA